jgi:hypothetical protein
MANSKRDENFVTSLLGVSSSDGKTPVVLWADETTHRLLVDITGLSSHFQTDTFTSTNNQTIFTASATVVADFEVHINGSLATPSSEYTVSGNTLTLASGIPSGNVVVWKYII